jgi:hypothetical protein
MTHFKPFPYYVEIGFYMDEFRLYGSGETVPKTQQPNFKYSFILHDNLYLNILHEIKDNRTFIQKLDNIKWVSDDELYAKILNKRLGRK